MLGWLTGNAPAASCSTGRRSTFELQPPSFDIVLDFYPIFQLFLDKMREVLVEQVKWRREDIKHTALRIVGFYTQNLAHFGTSHWIDLAERMMPAILGDRIPRQITLVTEGFELEFVPPRPVLIPVIKDGLVIWQEKEPRLIFYDHTYPNLSPSFRNFIYKVNDAIAQEASDTYKLHTSKDPFCLVFPKNEYGRTLLDRAVLINLN